VSDSRAAFNEHAESYDQYALVQRDLVEWMGALVRDELRGGCCLEYGAGTGLLTRLLVESFEEVLASDVSEEMVRVGKGHVPEAVWEVRDAWASRQSGESFDCVASASLLQWAVEPVVVERVFFLLSGGR